MAKAAHTVWWLAGEEQCPRCLQPYAYALEAHCVDCDAPLCPFCVVSIRRTRSAYCPECVPVDAGGE